ncbi:MAG TPA: AMP-binding protein [Jatrophihabitans sp.]|nr:AMP-binding protein [Jatrophihabitans sp.]
MTSARQRAIAAAAHSSIHDLVQHWIDTAPERIAVRDGATAISYAELSRRADACAARLHRLGVRPGSTVAVRLPKSADLIAVLLAVLRLGAAYSLIGADWPPARVAAVLDRLAPAILVGERAELGTASTVRGWWPDSSPCPQSYPRPAVSGADPYAVFFTSGTTGDPKGVRCPHAGLTRLAVSNPRSAFHVRTAAAQSLALPWDFAALEIWGTLLCGASLLLVHDRYLTGPALAGLVAENALDTVFLATSVFAALAEECPAAFAGVAKVVVGGEALAARHCLSVLRRCPELELINAYGPVEAGIFASTHRITMSDVESGRIPIGAALPGSQLRIEAADGRPSSRGPGELLIGGAGIALGYLGDQELTERRFVTRQVEGQRMTLYRTGDIVRADEQGRLHFVGRDDEQVKIRGLRVEPAEVAALICAAPAVRDCVVLAHQPEAAREPALLAFYIPVGPADPAAVHRVLAGTAAPHQLPHRLLPVPAFPLSSNGKLDRAALLRMAERPDAADDPGERVQQASLVVTPELAAVRALIAEVLGLSAAEVPGPATFAELGASSLDLGRIAVRLGRMLQRPVPLSVLFEHGTVRDLAGWIASGHAGEIERVAAPGSGAAELSPAQSYFLADQLRDRNSVEQNCVFSWRLAGALDLQVLARAWQHLHHRHEALRSGYQFRYGSRVIPLPVAAPALFTERVGSEADLDDELRRLGSRRFSPRTGEVWYPFAISVAGPGPVTVFGLCAHHIAIDGGSARLLADDLADTYYQLSCGVQPSLPPVAGVAAASAVRRQGLAQRDLAGQRAFWARTLADLPVQRLPRGRPGTRAAVSSHRARLTPAETSALAAVADRLGVTVFSVYLAAYAEAMHRLTRSRELAVLTAVEQRSAEPLRRQVNCLIAFLCLRLHGLGASPPAAAIRAAAGAIQRAGMAQDVSFLEGLPVGSAPGQQDRLASMFLLQDNFDSAIPIGGRVAGSHPAPYPALPVDLLAEVIPHRGGGAGIHVHVRPARVAADFPARLAAAMRSVLLRYPAELRAAAHIGLARRADSQFNGVRGSSQVMW